MPGAKRNAALSDMMYNLVEPHWTAAADPAAGVVMGFNDHIHKRGSIKGLVRGGYAYDGNGIRYECPDCDHAVTLTRCTGQTAAGTRCRKSATYFPSYCADHQDQWTGEAPR